MDLSITPFQKLEDSAITDGTGIIKHGTSGAVSRCNDFINYRIVLRDGRWLHMVGNRVEYPLMQAFSSRTNLFLRLRRQLPEAGRNVCRIRQRDIEQTVAAT